MKQFLSFIKKEFYHILRDRQTTFILLGMPIAQIIIFGFALTNEVKNADMLVFNQNPSAFSAQLIQEIDASRYFTIKETVNSTEEINQLFKRNKAKIALVIPPNFSIDAVKENKATVQIIADATDPNIATTLTNYVSNIIRQFQQNQQPTVHLPMQIQTETHMLYNPELKGAYSFVPGVMAMVLMLICTMMTSIAIVKEKESGTMEILLASPAKPMMVVLAKAVPYFSLSVINVVSILLLSVTLLGVPIKGNLLLLFAEATLFIITCLSIGLLISTSTNSQQVAMLISLMGMFLPTIMFSGFMFPIENMPKPMQIITNIVPAKWFYTIAKSVMIKGLGWSAIWKETLVLLGMTSFFVTLSIKKFHIRLV